MSPRLLFWRLFYLLTNPFQRLYWRVVKPRVRGVKCLIEKDGKFLLVKLAYAHRGWTLPGGRVERKESYEQAAWRELLEETAVRPSSLSFIGKYEHNRKGKADTIECFYGVSESDAVTVDPLEIEEAKWLLRSDFPSNRSERVDTIMKLYDNRDMV